MINYTPEQLKVLNHDPRQHACILAGPGTGKSSTIIAYIAMVRKQYPGKIVRLLTFTRAANGELIDKILEEGHDQIVSSTVHSFAISVLLSNPGISALPEPLRIADDWEWKELIRRDIAKRLSLNVMVIDKLKNEMSAQWESLVSEEDTDIPNIGREEFMGMWEEHRSVYGYSLLSELPFRMKIALETDPNLDIGNVELLAVDEFQDLNACDLRCLKLLSGRGVIIIAIGDDDQSIYKFRKAHPAGIRNFPEEYNANNYPLTISHRCGKKILEWANYVIEGDTSRPPKASVKPAENNPEGSVGYLVFNRENSEAEGIVRIIQWLCNQNRVPLEEILVLVRTSVVSRLMKETFQKHNILYSDPEEMLAYLKEKKTRELLNILRLLVNLNDSLAWWTLLYITKGIGESVISRIYDLARFRKCQFSDVLLQEAATGFGNISIGKKVLSGRIRQVLELLESNEVPDQAQWGSWIREQARRRNLPKLTEGFKDLLSKIDDQVEDIERLTLGQYINQIEPLAKDITNSKTSGRLRIMTLSRSKGLTVRAAIIACAEDGVIPHPKGDYQEERRLLYVGMTRARDFLYVTRSRRRIGQTARSGRKNVAGVRLPCPFLSGGPVNQLDGENYLKKIGA